MWKYRLRGGGHLGSVTFFLNARIIFDSRIIPQQPICLLRLASNINDIDSTNSFDN